MNKFFEVDPRFSTTRRLIKANPHVISDLLKQANNPEDQFDTFLFLPEGENRQGEGGLRTKGNFKVGGLITEVFLTASASFDDCEQSEKIYLDDPHRQLDIPNEMETEYPIDTLTHYNSPLTKSIPQQKPLITIVTVVYNGEKFLEETILSVINQTYQNVEYIIIDGGSTDGTLDIIKKYENAIDYWVSEKDKGIYDAMNKGIHLATGEWINFMNSDDLLAFDGVIKEVASSSLSAANSSPIIYGALNLINQKGELLLFINNSPELVKSQIKTKLAIPHQAQFIKLSIIKKINKFKSGYRIAADYEMTIRLFREGNFHHINGLNVAKMRIGGLSSDSMNSRELLLEYRKAQVENGIRMTGGFALSWIRFYLRLFLWKVFGESMTRKILDFGNKILRRETFWNKAQK